MGTNFVNDTDFFVNGYFVCTQTEKMIKDIMYK